MNVQLWEGCPWREISILYHSLNPLSCGAQGNSGIEQRIFFFPKEIILPISSVDGFYCTGSLRVLLLHYLICFWGSWSISKILMSRAVRWVPGHSAAPQCRAKPPLRGPGADPGEAPVLTASRDRFQPFAAFQTRGGRFGQPGAAGARRSRVPRRGLRVPFLSRLLSWRRDACRAVSKELWCWYKKNKNSRVEIIAWHPS